MGRSLALTLASAVTLAGCGGAAAQGTHVLGEKVTRTVGCSGWFEVEGDTLYAHLRLVGAVRSMDATATFTDGRTFSLGLPTPVQAGTTEGTFRFPVVLDAGVLGTTVRVRSGRATATCELAVPH